MSRDIERFTVFFRGVAIGLLDGLFVDGVLLADLLPLAGLESVRETLCDASRAVDNFGFLPPAGRVAGGVSYEGAAAGAVALNAARAIYEEIELRDSEGRPLPAIVDCVFGGRTVDEPFTVAASVDDARSAVPAELRMRPTQT